MDCARIEVLVGRIEAAVAPLRHAQRPGKVRFDLHGLKVAKLGRKEALQGNAGDGVGPRAEIRGELGSGRKGEAEVVRRAAVPVSDQRGDLEGPEARADLVQLPQEMVGHGLCVGRVAPSVVLPVPLPNVPPHGRSVEPEDAHRRGDGGGVRSRGLLRS